MFHSGDSLPSVSNISASLTPVNALDIYYNAQGWVNTNVQPFLRRLCVDSTASACNPPATPSIRPVAIAINLSGMAERCDPLAAAGDSRACSP